MLILVSQLIENCFGLIKRKLESIIVLLVLGFPLLGFAQQSEFEFSAPPLPRETIGMRSDEPVGRASGFHQQLSPKHVSTPGLVSSLSIGEQEKVASPAVLLDSIGAPEPPKDLLMPEGPTAKSFGEPLANDLRAEVAERNSDSGVVAANIEMAIEESPLSPSGTFVPIQKNGATTQQPAAQFTADRLRSEFLPTLDKDQFRSAKTQVAPPLNRPMQEVLTASEIPTHAPVKTNFSASQGQDSAVQLAGFSEPVYKKTKSIPLTAKELISRYSLEEYANPLPGQPVNLVDFFQQPLSLERRSMLVRQYWETYFDWANYVAAERYSQWLKRVPVPESTSEQALLTAVEAVVANDVMAAEVKLLKSQAMLAQFWPVLSQNSVNPIPNDLPLIQRYNTNYELYLSRRLVPSKFRGIDQVLPKMLALIERRAEAVGYSKSAADRMLAPTQSEHLLTTLEAGKVFYTAECDLIDSVVSYNRAIGDYALSVATQPKSAAEVVEMLIAKVPVSSTTKNVIPADVNPPAEANASDVSTSVISKPKAPTVSIARAMDFTGQRASGDTQAGTTSVLQAKKDAQNLDTFVPPESDIISGRRPVPIGGVGAKPVPLPKVTESESGFSLSPASKPPVLKSPEARAPDASSGFMPPTGFKTTPTVDDNQFSNPPSEKFKTEDKPSISPLSPSRFQLPGNTGTGANGTLKPGGFTPPKFSAPGFNPSIQE